MSQSNIKNKVTINLSTVRPCSWLDFAFDNSFGIFEYSESSDSLLSEFERIDIAFKFWYGAKKRSLSSISECISILSFRWVRANSTISISFSNFEIPFLKEKVSRMNV